MTFYHPIAHYYDDLFPISMNQIRLIQKIVGPVPKKMLDVACATGSYAVYFSQQGYDVTAVDLDEEMITKLREKKQVKHLNLNIYVADMLFLNQTLFDTYDFIYCIGNSLVHLHHHSEVMKFLSNMYDLLNMNGHILLQILNYDRIKNQNINALPLIKGEGLTFERTYQQIPGTDEFLFHTLLTVDNQQMEQTIGLYPIEHQELLTILNTVGFKQIICYGDFIETPFDPETSYGLIISAKKE